jgi:hypothetical protein
MNIGGNTSTDWQPLVQNYSVDVRNMNLVQNGGQYSLSVPYTLSVSDMISGAPLELKVTMRNDTGTVAMTDQRIVLGPGTSGNLVLNLTAPAAQYLLSHQEKLHFDAQALFFNASEIRTYDYDWVPPISGLGMGQPYLSQSPTALVLPLHFNTSVPVTGRSITLATSMTVNGAASGSGSITQIAQSVNVVALQIPISTSTLHNLGANSATVAFTVMLTSNGLTEQQTFQYQWSPVIP